LSTDIPSQTQLGRAARLLITAAGTLAIGFFGISMLLKVLYVLRLGHGPTYIGWFGAAGSITYMSMSLPSGALGSRFGTRKVMLVGAVIMLAGMALLPLTEFVPIRAQNGLPVVSEVITTIGWCLVSVNLVPGLTTATTARNRGRAFALYSAFTSLGMLVGTLVGGLLPGLFGQTLSQTLDMPGPYRLALWTSTIPGLVALIPLGLLRPIGQVAIREQTKARGPFPFVSMVPMIVYVILRHSGWATCQAFCTPYMDVGLHLSASAIGLITSVGMLLAILAPLITPRLAARYSNGWTLTMSTLGISISLLPLALIPHWAAAGLARLSILVLSAIWLPAFQVFQMDMVDSEWRSLAYGAVSMAMGLGFGTTSLAGGYIIAAVGYRPLFLLGVGLSLAGAAFLWVMLRRRAGGLKRL